MIRVDHAGEYGAKRIYDGQLAVLGKSGAAPAIREMAEAEQAHLDAFDNLLVERRVRPTALSPVWHVAGFALGAASALLGERAAMACTVAVEEVIEEHYAGQARRLGEDEPELRRTLEQFGADEAQHRETGLAHGAEQAPGYEAVGRGQARHPARDLALGADLARPCYYGFRLLSAAKGRRRGGHSPSSHRTMVRCTAPAARATVATCSARALGSPITGRSDEPNPIPRPQPCTPHTRPFRLARRPTYPTCPTQSHSIPANPTCPTQSRSVPANPAYPS